MIVETVGLEQVDYVESVGSTSSSVTKLKVKPLIIDFSKIIWLQNQIIFKFINLNCTAKVARFKSGFEAQGEIVL